VTNVVKNNVKKLSVGAIISKRFGDRKLGLLRWKRAAL
jgi:hypothetical protein